MSRSRQGETLSFLAAHVRNPLTFSIGGRLYPISLRDQIVRATGLIDRAVEANLIRYGDTCPLLVVGAGLGGVAAALRAAAWGVETMLVERESEALMLQGGCATRRICPTQYDWPAEHWQRGHYPWDAHGGVPPQSHPFFWRSNYANALALVWRAKLDTETRRPRSKLLFRPLTAQVMAPAYDPALQAVHTELRDLTTGQTFGLTARAIVLARGFGDEKVYLAANHPTRGVQFWATDSLIDPDLGLGGDRPEVVISGSGDGALQDFIRICTGENDIAALYRNIIPAELRSILEVPLRDAQDRAQRAYIWGSDAAHDHDALAMLHQKYAEAVDLALTHHAHGGTVLANLLATVRPRSIRLVHSCTHFTNCYGLNRFLVLLIARYMERIIGSLSVLIPERNIEDASGSNGHHCCGQALGGPDPCYGAPHDVILCERPDCRQPPVRRAETWTGVNVLIMRHGVDQTSAQERLSPPSSRQLLPYDLPY